MTRSDYLRTLLQAYVEAPDQPRRHDRAIAVELYRSGVPLEHLLHAIRLASLRRHLSGPHPPVHSLAYYKAVLLALTSEELEPQPSSRSRKAVPSPTAGCFILPNRRA